MGAILYAFDNVPAPPSKEDIFEAEKAVRGPRGSAFHAGLAVLARRDAVAGIYQDLERLGHPQPEDASHEVTRPALVAHLQEVVGAIVSAALESGPADDGEAAAQVNADLGRVLHGVPYAPNELTAADIRAARGG